MFADKRSGQEYQYSVSSVLCYTHRMLNFNSIMIGSSDPKRLGEFYEKVFGKKPDMQDGSWYGWQVGSCFFNVGEHSEVHGKAKEPQRIILNLETTEVREEFERIKKEAHAEVVKEPYAMSETGEVLSGAEAEEGMWIATFADCDGNYFQLMSPWKEK